MVMYSNINTHVITNWMAVFSESLNGSKQTVWRPIMFFFCYIFCKDVKTTLYSTKGVLEKKIGSEYDQFSGSLNVDNLYNT